MSEAATATSATTDPFEPFLHSVQARFAAVGPASGARLFATDADGLYEAYLDGLPAEARQHHTCSCCRTFIGRFGGLAIITNDGRIEPALWAAAGTPEIYRASVDAMARAVRRARIVSPFLAGETTWGQPESGGWTHLWVPGVAHVGVLTPGQAMAARREDFGTLSRALEAYDRRVVAQAVTLLKAESLYRSEKVMGPAAFLLRLHDEMPRRDGPARDALLWRAVADAPPGFCTPRSAMVGTLLDDIAAGMPFEDVKRRFGAKMHPLQYQRPQAAPSAGAIAQAERLFEQMGLAQALLRRFARLDEVQTLWRPPAASPPAGGISGVFGHLAPRADASAPSMDMQAQPITWAKFARVVLPGARRIEVRTDRIMEIAGVLTAVDPDAPPLLQWDRPEARNPVSWYVYHGGSTPAHWGLPSGAWVTVPAVALFPTMWAGEDAYAHQGKRVLFVIEGARDRREGGLGLFPECLRSELHGVRAVIEAHSRSRQPEGREEGSANGLVIGGGTPSPPIRVTGEAGAAIYQIDRWE